jgi:hypothetical protein
MRQWRLHDADRCCLAAQRGVVCRRYGRTRRTILRVNGLLDVFRYLKKGKVPSVFRYKKKGKVPSVFRYKN